MDEMRAEVVKKLYRRSVAIATAGGAFVIALLLVSLFLYLRVEKTRKELAHLKSAHKKQEILSPAYLELVAAKRELLAMLEEMEKEGGAAFISGPEVGALPEEFRVALASTGLDLKSCAPDIDSVAKGERSFGIKIVFTGSFVRVPMFLSMLEAERRITSIRRVKVFPDGERKRYEMDLWVDMDA